MKAPSGTEGPAGPAWPAAAKECGHGPPPTVVGSSAWSGHDAVAPGVRDHRPAVFRGRSAEDLREGSRAPIQWTSDGQGGAGQSSRQNVVALFFRSIGAHGVRSGTKRVVMASSSSAPVGDAHLIDAVHGACRRPAQR